MDELLQIWVPFDGVLKQFMPFKEGFVSLFKRKDEDVRLRACYLFPGEILLFG